MNLLKPHNLEDQIIKLLIEGEAKTSSLLEKIRITRLQTTKQGFYAALRKLKRDDVLLTYKGKASLSRAWLQEMASLLEKASAAYKTKQALSDVLGLEDKENLTYAFSNIKNLDIFWGYAQNIIMHNTPNSEPIYAYDPHYWLYVARIDSEKKLLKEITNNGRQFLMTVGNSYPLDKAIKTDFNSNYLQYNFNKLFEGENYYCTVIDDYVTEVWLDSSTCSDIHELYMTEQELKPITTEALKLFLDRRGKNKIKISRNRTRATKLKKKMGKDFYVIRQK